MRPNVVSWNPNYGVVYSILHYALQLVSDLQQVGGVLQVLWVPPPIKLTAIIKTETLLNVLLNITTLTRKL